MLGTGCWVKDVGFRMLGTVCWVKDVGYRMLGTGCWVQDVGYRMLGTGCWVPYGEATCMRNSIGNRIGDPRQFYLYMMA